MKQNIANLIKVKTIVTFVVTTVFAVLALRGDLTPAESMTIISLVLGCYFGSQSKKNELKNNEREGITNERNN